MPKWESSPKPGNCQQPDAWVAGEEWPNMQKHRYEGLETKKGYDGWGSFPASGARGREGPQSETPRRRNRWGNWMLALPMWQLTSGRQMWETGCLRTLHKLLLALFSQLCLPNSPCPEATSEISQSLPGWSLFLQPICYKAERLCTRVNAKGMNDYRCSWFSSLFYLHFLPQSFIIFVRIYVNFLSDIVERVGGSWVRPTCIQILTSLLCHSSMTWSNCLHFRITVGFSMKTDHNTQMVIFLPSSR